MMLLSKTSSTSQYFQNLGIYMDRYNLIDDRYYSTIYFTKPLTTVEQHHDHLLDNYLTLIIIGRAPSGSPQYLTYHLNLLDQLTPGTPSFLTSLELTFGTSYGPTGIVQTGHSTSFLTPCSYVRFKLANNDKASPLIYTADIGWYRDSVFDRLYRIGSGARTEGTQMVFTSTTNDIYDPIGSIYKTFHFDRIHTIEIQPTYLFSSHHTEDYLYINMPTDNPSNISYDYEFAAVTNTGELRTVLVSGQDLTTVASSVTTMLGALSTLGISVTYFSVAGGYIGIGDYSGTSGLFEQGIRLFGLRKMNA